MDYSKYLKDIDFSKVLSEEEEEDKEIQAPPPVLSLEEEEEEDTTTKTDYSKYLKDIDIDKLQGIAEEKASINLEDIDASRKVQYGIAQETTIGGNLARYFKAFAKSAISDESFSESLKDIEDERQKDIFREFSEFKGLKETEEDASILAGRLGVAVFDPVTWLVPWTKVAKAGMIASTATTGAFAAGDAALRDKMLYGEVNPLNVGAATVLGSAGGALSSKLAGKLKGDAIEEATEAIKNVKPTKLDIDPEEVIPITPKEASTVEASARRTVPESVAEELENMPSLTSQHKVIDDLNIRIKELKSAKRKKGVTKEIKAEMDERIEKYQKLTIKKREDLIQNTFRRDKLNKDNNLAIAEDLSERGELTRGVLKTLIFEPTRPIMGAVGGYATSGIIGDEDSDALTVGMMVAGASLGNWATLIKRSNLTDFDKKGAMEVIDDVASKNLRRSIKIMSAGTTATRMDAMGGWAKAIGKMMFGTVGGPHQGLEDITSRHQREFVTVTRKIFGDSFADSDVEKTVGEVIRGFHGVRATRDKNALNQAINKIRVGYKGIDGSFTKGLSEEQIAEVRRIAPQIQDHQNTIKQGYKDVGVEFNELDDYGMAQLWDWEAIAKDQTGFVSKLQQALDRQSENFTETVSELKKKKALIIKRGGTADEIKNINSQIRAANKHAKSKDAEEFLKSLRGDKTLAKKDLERRRYGSMFSKNGKFSPPSKHFDYERQLVDVEGTQLMAESGFLNMNAREVVESYGENSIKVLDWSRKFGANGELIKIAFEDINKAFAGSNLQRFKKQYENQIMDSIDGYWGVFGKGDNFDEKATTAVAALTSLANMSFLTRVSITSLGDVIQPFQNSGFGATAKALIRKANPKKVSFSKQANFRYDDSFEREITAMLIKGGDPLNVNQRRIATANRRFFKAVGLQAVTNHARDFAFDTGVNRAFKLANKKNLTKANLSELDQLGLYVDDLEVIKKYKNVDEAFEAGDARNLLDRAGVRSANRDAIVPSVGNRLLFAQSRNPYMKSLGQFLSWAQAKTSQTNALAGRIDNGDAALATRMLGLTAVYGGVGQMREWAKPTYDDEKGRIDDFISEKGLKKALELSGNWTPWQVDKALRTAQSMFYNKGPAESSIPVVSFLGEAGRRLAGAGRNLWQGDIEGAVSQVMRGFPLLKDVHGFGKRLDLPVPEDDPPPKNWRLPKSIGGVVEDVPQVPKEPDERIDKLTGRPYNEQAGTAYIDEEDPVRRLGFLGGGLADNPIRRLGFGWGGIASAIVRRFGDDVVPTSGVSKESDEILRRAKKEVDNIVEESTVAKADEVINPQISKTAYDQTWSEFENIEDVDEWKDVVKKYVKDNRDVDPNVRTPELEESAKELIDAKTIDRAQHLKNIQTYKPITPWDVIPREPSTKSLIYSLKSKQREDGKFIVDDTEAQKFNVSESLLSIGDFFNGRLDIEAYKTYDTWIVAGTSKNHKKTHYAKAIHYTGKDGEPVKFSTSKKIGEKIGKGEKVKTAYATVGGWVKSLNANNIRKKAENLLDDPDWTQVGFDPRRQGAFYIRSGAAIGEAVKEAEEVIQIGPLLLAKKVVIDPDYTGYVQGGKVYKALRKRKVEGGMVESYPVEEEGSDLEEAPPEVYKIKSGDTLYKIAEERNVLVEDLVVANDIDNPDKIQAGEVLIVPNVPPVITETIDQDLILTDPPEITSVVPDEEAEEPEEDSFNRFISHLILREDDKNVGVRSHKDSLGFLTFGVGHRMTDEEIEMYPEGTEVPEEVRREALEKDSSKAWEAANNQAKELNVKDSEFIEALASVNFQLGTSWNKIHDETWKKLKRGDWEEAALEAARGKNPNSESLWFQQTPTRVKDFQKAIRNLKKMRIPKRKGGKVLACLKRIQKAA